MKSAEKLALIPVTLGQVHLEQISERKKRRFLYANHFLLFVLLYQFNVLYLRGSGKEITIATCRYPSSFRIFYSIYYQIRL